MYRSISGNLYGPIPINNPAITITLCVVITDNNDNYAFSRYIIQGKDYITFNPKGYIRIKYTCKDTPWERHHQVIITQRNIYQMRLGLKAFYQQVFGQTNLFEYDERNKLVRCNADERDDRIIELGMAQVIRLRPTIVDDRQGTLYPGVNITINREENQSNLSIEEFEGLVDLFSHIDLFQASLSLLQTYIVLHKNPSQNIKTEEVSKPERKGSRFSSTTQPKGDIDDEYTVIPPTKVEQPKTLDELN